MVQARRSARAPAMPRPSPALLNFSGDFIEVQYAGSCLARAQGCRVPIRIALVPCCPIAVKPRQSSRHVGSNRRPNGRLWATLPLGLTRGNGSRLLEPPTTACTGGPSFVDACMRTVSERSPRSVRSVWYTAHHVRRRHCRPVSLTHSSSPKSC